MHTLVLHLLIVVHFVQYWLASDFVFVLYQSADEAQEYAQNANANAQSINIRTFQNVESMKQASPETVETNV